MLIAKIMFTTNNVCNFYDLYFIVFTVIMFYLYLNLRGNINRIYSPLVLLISNFTRVPLISFKVAKATDINCYFIT